MILFVCFYTGEKIFLTRLFMGVVTTAFVWMVHLTIIIRKLIKFSILYKYMGKYEIGLLYYCSAFVDLT